MQWVVDAEAALRWATAKQRETPSIINVAAEAEAVQAYNCAVDALEGRISARKYAEFDVYRKGPSGRPATCRLAGLLSLACPVARDGTRGDKAN
jgi:hypothetical protein